MTSPASLRLSRSPSVATSLSFGAGRRTAGSEPSPRRPTALSPCCTDHSSPTSLAPPSTTAGVKTPISKGDESETFIPRVLMLFEVLHWYEKSLKIFETPHPFGAVTRQGASGALLLAEPRFPGRAQRPFHFYHRHEEQWCDRQGSVDEVRSKLHMEHESAAKSERAIAYSLSNQPRGPKHSGTVEDQALLLSVSDAMSLVGATTT
ncbi:hypothetical protein U9M48_044726 [Paspalum notatum var. saurae]|uniref:Uncharacterized protein n=1 Tax=Paspalum notatum var. saurae TaxID=547442 RepID=A0AAQ3UXP9_PASNO